MQYIACYVNLSCFLITLPHLIHVVVFSFGSSMLLQSGMSFILSFVHCSLVPFHGEYYCWYAAARCLIECHFYCSQLDFVYLSIVSVHYVLYCLFVFRRKDLCEAKHKTASVFKFSDDVYRSDVPPVLTSGGQEQYYIRTALHVICSFCVKLLER